MATSIGLVANQSDVAGTLRLIQDAERLGIPTVWLIQAGLNPDSLAVFTAAATQTKQIAFGTAIIPIWPRHPLVVAQQAATVMSLAPNRLRLGLGPAGPVVTQMYGIPYEHPLGHLREYITILKTIFANGQVDFDGSYYKAHGRLGAPNQPPARLNVPVMASALQRGSFEFCGQVADGALSWVCPVEYLRAEALPAIKSGAEKAGRAAPPLIAHVPVAVGENVSEVRDAVRTVIGIYPRLPHYQKMFKAAGFPEVAEEQWSDRMIQAVVVHGNATTVRQRLHEILDSGIAEIMVHPIPTGSDRAASLAQILETISR
jgi:F420-dependent oxidoreductase-like protein